MKKYLSIICLAALCVAVVSKPAHAQTRNGLLMGSFTIPDRGVKVTHTVLEKGISGTVTFTLDKEGGKALESGSSFILTLPVQDGLTYDLLSLPGIRRMPLGVGALPTLTLNTSAGNALVFSCRVLKTAVREPANQQIFVRVN